MKVTKSSGILQDFNTDKIIRVLEWACRDTDVDPYALFEMFTPHLIEGMSTKTIQEGLVSVASNAISIEETDYQYVASNLRQFALRKEVYGQFDPVPFLQHVKRGLELGIYDPDIGTKWTDEEIELLGQHINHDLDFKLSYAGTSQLIDKYLVQDRSKGVIYETPQMAYMLIGMCLHQDEPIDKRIQYVLDFYEAVSNREISLPTPIMGGVRTPTRQFSSCVVIESDDSLDGINAATSAIVKYASRRAGIGINGGMIRAEGSKIRQGEVKHTGVIPFWKHFLTAVGATSQGGIRKGSATCYYPSWHLELENLIVLKNNKGTEESRIRHMDYGIQVNNLMIKRWLNNDYITLFSPDVMGGALYRAFFEDEELFEELYTQLENDPSIRKKRIKAVDLFAMFFTERSDTSRIYPMHVDNVNNYGPFIRAVAPITMSNLCTEIAIPTRPLGKKDGMINLCTLSAWVLDSFDFRDQARVNKLAMIMVRALNNLLDYQDYPVDEALGSLDYRSLGIGVTNYASFLASNMASYEDANALTHELFERLQYALLRASVDMAKERGPAPRWKETRYGQGMLPIDKEWYCNNVDELTPPVYVLSEEWEELREDLNLYGILNCTVSALMPCETSSQVSNSTNGIEKPKSIITIKLSKSGTFSQVIPNAKTHALLYDFKWESFRQYGNKGYLTQACIMQKFVDQAISVNFDYNPYDFENNRIPMSYVADDMLYFWYYGGKNAYYQNTYDGAGEEDDSDDCVACKV